MSLTDFSLTFQPIGEAHLPILRSIYRSTREAELELVPQWSDDAKAAFVAQQFEAQHTYYQENYKGADFQVILYKNQIIGRLYLHENFEGKEMRIIDITLLPEWRRKGLGTKIFQDLKTKATELNKPLSIHVESFNPAKRLYERLGFAMVSETNGVYHLMQWNPLT